MPNVLLTQSCVRHCPYCFAKKHMLESSPDDILSWENLVYIVDFLQAAGETRFSMLGGEPTLHPAFRDMVLYVVERGFGVNVFTSGIMRDSVLRDIELHFRDIPPDRLSFTCNINDPGKTPTPLAETESLRRFLGAFGARVVPGFNIYRPDFELGYVFGLINEFGLRRQLRIGLAHPIAGRTNRFIAPADMPAVLARLFSFAPQFERLRIHPGFDCGFPLCKLTDGQLGWLYRHTGGRYDFGCATVLDICPDMSIISCFPLSSFHRRSLYDFDSLAEIHAYYGDLHRKIRVEMGGIYEECDNCRFREERLCAGGCLAHCLNAFRTEHPVRMQEVYC